MENKIKCPQCAYWFDVEEAISGKPITCFKTVNEKKFGKPQKNRKDEIQCPNCGYWFDFKSVTSGEWRDYFIAEYKKKLIKKYKPKQT